MVLLNSAIVDPFCFLIVAYILPVLSGRVACMFILIDTRLRQLLSALDFACNLDIQAKK